ncbi:MAG: hypothetical protein Q8O99_01695 [bacterium]|nr:hypothetical protein [bacterium]
MLQAHKKAGELPEIKALFQSPGLLKGRQKFLLTEKERVASLGCDINLGIYGKSKDGIDGVWGPATATSTTNYLQWLFDASHPGRLDRVRTKLQARVTNEKGGNKKNSREKAARFLEEARLQVQRQKDEI